MQTEQIINNICFFYKGKLSQWHGGFPNHDSKPIKIQIWKFSKFYKYDPLVNYHANMTQSYLIYDGYDTPGYIEFSSAEQAMMFAKAIIFGDFEMSEKILQEKHPGKIQTLGRQIKKFDQNYWNSINFDLLSLINYEKFSQDENLKEFLLSTGNLILAENSDDMIYGTGIKDEYDCNKWPGENLLGRVLMQVREQLKSH